MKRHTKKLALFIMAFAIPLFLFQNCGIEAPNYANLSSTGINHDLVKDLSCTLCHESDRPAPRNNIIHGNGANCVGCHEAGTSWSIGVKFDHFGVTENCASCHGDGRLNDSWPKDPLFPHRLIANRDCNNCHTPTTWSSGSFGHLDVTTCAECHEPDFQVVINHPDRLGNDCASCHVPTTWDSVDPHYPPPNNCVSCHGPSAPTDRITAQVTHPEYGGLDCSTCHTDNYLGGLWLPGEFPHVPRPGNCASCHQSKFDNTPTHRKIDGRDCTFCHSPGSDLWKPALFTHKKINDPNSDVDTCIACHGGEQPNTPSHAGITDCTTCHSPAQGTWRDGSYTHISPQDDSNCARCHGAGQVNDKFTTANHRPLAPLSLGQANPDCSTCHDNSLAFINATFDHLNPQVPTQCSGCHGPTLPSKTNSVIHTQYSQNDCASCHTPKPAGWINGAQFDHNGVTTNCSSCHGAGMKFDRFNKIPAHRPTDGRDCSSCHNAKPVVWANAAFDHTGTTNNCTSCHSQQYNQFTDHHQFGVNAMDCATCHTAGGFWSPTIFTHPSGILAQNDCRVCHEYKKPADNTHLNVTTCASCHSPAQGAWNNVTFNHISPQHDTNCASCHGAGQANDKISGVNHRIYGATTLGGPIPDCSSCHHYSRFFTQASFSHNPAPQQCKECHGPTTPLKTNSTIHVDNANLDCVSCHQPKPTLWQNGTFSHSGITNNCASCHASDKPTPHIATGNQDCSSCHGTPPSLWSDADPHVPTPQSCSGCHGNNQSFDRWENTHRMTDGRDCIECHITGDTRTVWSTASFNHSAQGSANCSSCHEFQRPGSTSSEVRGWMSNAPNISNIKHFVANNGANQMNCYMCHESKTRRTNWNFVHRDGTGLEIKNCLPCHWNKVASNHINNNRGGYVIPNNKRGDFPNGDYGFDIDNDCKTCHTHSNISGPRENWK